MGSREREWGLLVALGMPPLPKDQTYQLWLVSGAQSFDGGAFIMDDAGYGQLSLRMAESLRTFDRVRVTVEPLGGSLQPTTDPILLGSLFTTRTN
ncbi:MAG: anti-sigma factor [Dehalococcoidia bacterium]|nr:anti-sigma factor [Dehalococcoidia bacterium]